MKAIKAHWITALAMLGTTFLAATGIGMAISGGDDGSTGIRVFGSFAIVAALALGVGLWGLRAAALPPRVAYPLVVAGLIFLGVGYWWFVLLPPLLALVVLVAGVYRRGLERELRPGL